MSDDSALKGLKALVVEDNEFVRLMVKKHLKDFGISSVFVAGDGQEGLQMAIAKVPDIIICDIEMKPMNGFEFLEKLRAVEPPVSQLPVIFLTSSADEEGVKKAIDLSVDAYLLKPVSPEKLRRLISKLIALRWTA